MKFYQVPSKPYFKVSEEGVLKFTKTNTTLKPYTDRDGYLRCVNHDSERKYYIAVHRAVAEVFVKNPEPKKYNIVNHINSVRDDNRPENLEWVDSKLNRQHCDVSGNWNCKGSKHSQALLSEEKVVKICHMITSGLRVKDIAESFNVKRHVISQIKTGRSWRHVTEGLLLDVPPRQNTISKSTVAWCDEQLKRGYSNQEILCIAKTLDENKLDKIKNIIKECNDYL